MKNQNIAYNGCCAFALSTGKTNVNGGKFSLVVDETTYLFSNIIAKILFKIIPSSLDKANKNWETQS